jgi:hypothetical protein
MHTIFGPIGLANLLECHLDYAVVWLRGALQEQPGGLHLLAGLMSAYAHLGRTEDAQSTMQRLVENGPKTLTDWLRWFEVYSRESDRVYLLEGLRLAGVPEV